MGDILSKFRKDLVLVVKTGDRKGAGTDANVYASIEDIHGNQNVQVGGHPFFLLGQHLASTELSF